MPRLDRRSVVQSAAAGMGLLMAPAVIGKARAATPVTVASLLGPDKPETRIWHFIRDRVEGELPGAFDFRIVENAALGGEREVAEGLRLGSIQASLSTVSALSGWVPESQLLDLPFIFTDAAHLRRVLEGDIGIALKRQFADQSFVVADYINYGARHLLAKEPLLRPDQMQGKRIRVLQSPLHTELWSAYGANPTAIPIPETYNALQTGVVDCMDLTKSAYAGFKLYEVVPDLIETGHIWAAGVVYFSAGFWNGLTAEQQSVLQSAASDGARYFDRLIVEDEVASMETAKAAGGRVFQPEDRAAWIEGAQPVWQSLAPTVGGMERIEAARGA
ncbi:TRAP transporter substrate-binding protein [Marinivivus vitaminiproducens]|uniref:TRAP transporter substrate-binding protein n=1 Tax=Marinivivus vitaminiproducens TaxID=3035935 RepID=UPI0027AB3162|nr:TRAP transporter substrate-binding protein [Geminicoccaceae bacterium SCSIO 64248]